MATRMEVLTSEAHVRAAARHFKITPERDGLEIVVRRPLGDSGELVYRATLREQVPA